MNLEQLVRINPSGSSLPGSSRRGTVTATMYALESRIGRPHGVGDQFKVSCVWFFETPRGRVALRDYHLNRVNEWSIASTDRRAALWLAKYLRSIGIEATGRRKYE